MDTIKFAFEARSKVAYFNKLIPYPGTIYFDQYMQKRTMEECVWEDFVDVSMNTIIEHDAMSGQEILELAQKANKYFVGSWPIFLYNTIPNSKSPSTDKRKYQPCQKAQKNLDKVSGYLIG